MASLQEELAVLREMTWGKGDIGGKGGVACLKEELAELRVAIELVNERNVAKDRGKEFEGSYTRVLFIMGITYATLFGYLTLIGAERPALNAIVPAVGFNLSTWSLPYVKEVWIAWKVKSGTGTVTGAGTSSGSGTGTGTGKHVNRAKEELDDEEL
ncbi:hypothetical protein B484DRAFT_395145 [Ochromonadaceae sp. CCMP2298]|nr:hypothetical protein B484DRAFT_395145 [Ochromonadaceae sp. CCMP2298]